MGHFAGVGSGNVHIRESGLQAKADVELTLAAGGGYRHLLDVLLETDSSFQPVRADDAPDRAASGLAQIGFMLGARREIVVVSAISLFVNVIRP
jgi:hypothetical protein